MRKRLSATLFSLMLCAAPSLHATWSGYPGGYNGFGGYYYDTPAENMMGSMWEFMEWFLGRRDNRWRDPYGYGALFFNGPFASGWDDPYTPWLEHPPLDGTWLAQTGELWYLHGNRFVLLDNRGIRTPGEFHLEGEFLLARMPWGEVEFEYRQRSGLLVLRDVEGRLMVLRRVGTGGWNW